MPANRDALEHAHAACRQRCRIVSTYVSRASSVVVLADLRGAATRFARADPVRAFTIPASLARRISRLHRLRLSLVAPANTRHEFEHADPERASGRIARRQAGFESTTQSSEFSYEGTGRNREVARPSSRREQAGRTRRARLSAERAVLSARFAAGVA
ncbi:hypothetical protein [Burkholderia territorii]|uniref:hypothetical protein n=1 Tax=Burkholderia territorii TaxID=1503055 RepID=UPI0012D98A3D|nr:hypothetical protein [Burkholderia territorii]